VRSSLLKYTIDYGNTIISRDNNEIKISN